MTASASVYMDPTRAESTSQAIKDALAHLLGNPVPEGDRDKVIERLRTLANQLDEATKYARKFPKGQPKGKLLGKARRKHDALVLLKRLLQEPNELIECEARTNGPNDRTQAILTVSIALEK